MSEAHSSVARRVAQEAGQLPFTPLHDLELTNALQLLHCRHLIDGRQLPLLLSHVAEDRDDERLVETPIDLHRAFVRARELSLAHSAKIPCRSLDILHVASLLELGCRRLVSGDDRQLRLARPLSLETLDIKAGRRRRRT